MLNIFKRKKTEVEAVESLSLFGRLKKSLTRTRQHLGNGLARILLGKKTVDQALIDEIETQLLMADVGVEVCQDLINTVTQKLARKELADGEAVFELLKQELLNLLQPCEKPLEIPAQTTPFVILTVGVNGAGKTTTIGKLAKRLQSKGHAILLAAGDTFRAAAVEQLQIWGERNQIPVVAQQRGSDSASVVFDALQSAQARGSDVLIADTAGRLHTQKNLMQELEKVARVLKKLDPDAPHEVMLVLDASIGQNALHQAEQFHRSVPLTGITLTKLDGTAKGGIIFAIAKKMALPIRFIGVGESIDDLRPFDAQAFVNALFNQTNEEQQ